MTTSTETRTWVGRPVSRIDGIPKVTGAATYAAEHRIEGLAYAVIVESEEAAGRIEWIDDAAALAQPGVLAVLTHLNVPPLQPLPETPLIGDWRTPLGDDRIDYAGQDVAVVVATSVEQARHAASLVRVRIAADEQSPRLRTQDDVDAIFAEAEDGGNWRDHVRGDVASALSAPGTMVVGNVWTSPTEHHSPMEPSATIASWDGGQLTVYDSTQYVQGTASALATSFGIPVENVRVLCPYLGGGFGAKGPFWPHTVLTALAARQVGRPVKLVLARSQMFTSAGERPLTVQRMTLGARPDGTLTAIRHATVNVVSQRTVWIEPCGRLTSPALYACPNVSATHLVARSHIPPGSWMRGPGEALGTWALESAMDELAYELGIDPVELRLRNYAEVDPMTGRPWSAKHLRECIAQGAERFGWADRSPAPGSMRDGDTLIGYGMALGILPGHKRPITVRLRVDASGGARLQAAAHDLGTGTYTICAQLVADGLGVDLVRVEVELGDSAMPPGALAGGSATAATMADAIVNATAQLRAELDAGPARPGIDWPAILERAGRPFAEIEIRTGDVSHDDDHASASHGVYFCEVAIDPLQPRVEVRRLVSVWDIGRVLNPKTALSQVAGCIVMGLGMTLMEETRRDPRTGRPVNDNFAEYLMPVHADMRDFDISFIDVPDPRFGSLGVRGVGELGMAGIAPAIGNAVFHATGRRIRNLPLTPPRLLAAMEGQPDPGGPPPHGR